MFLLIGVLYYLPFYIHHYFYSVDFHKYEIGCLCDTDQKKLYSLYIYIYMYIYIFNVYIAMKAINEMSKLSFVICE